MKILTVNAGSSTVKVSMIGPGGDQLAIHEVPAGYAGDDELDALARLLRDLGRDADAVGHRVVHGGPDYHDAVRLDAEVRRRLRELTDLAPLHQQANLDAIELTQQVLPDVPAVACFDTVFHSAMPAAATTYAVPDQWRKSGVRRYGFHGLAHAAVTASVTALRGELPGRLVVCHLGSGASLAAVQQGRSVETTMGFTPLEGLVMSTRSGSVDPGLLIWLLSHAGLSATDLENDLLRRSGLLGLAGTADMRQVIAGRHRGDEAARLAFDVYVHRLRDRIAAMVAALGGIDVLAFSGGVGENSPEVRAAALAGMEFLGLGVDPGRNTAAAADAQISRPGARVGVYVVTAREDLQIAAATRRVIAGS